MEAALDPAHPPYATLDHYIYMYGQQSFDGWACRKHGCNWEGSYTMGREAAQRAHDRAVGLPEPEATFSLRLTLSDWERIENALGDYANMVNAQRPDPDRVKALLGTRDKIREARRDP